MLGKDFKTLLALSSVVGLSVAQYPGSDVYVTTTVTNTKTVCPCDSTPAWGGQGWPAWPMSSSSSAYPWQVWSSSSSSSTSTTTSSNSLGPVLGSTTSSSSSTSTMTSSSSSSSSTTTSSNSIGPILASTTSSSSSSTSTSTMSMTSSSSSSSTTTSSSSLGPIILTTSSSSTSTSTSSTTSSSTTSSTTSMTTTSTSSTTTSTTTTSTTTGACPSGTPFVVRSFGNSIVPDGTFATIMGANGTDGQFLGFVPNSAPAILELDNQCGLFLTADNNIADIDSTQTTAPVYFDSPSTIAAQGYRRCVCTIAGANNDLTCQCATANQFFLNGAGTLYISSNPPANMGLEIRASF